MLSSLRHRVDTTGAWVNKLERMVPATALSQELVRFDIQAMQNAEIPASNINKGHSRVTKSGTSEIQKNISAAQLKKDFLKSR